MQRARKPLVLRLHGCPSRALVKDVLFARVSAAVHGAHHRDHGEATAHKARRQPWVDQKGLSGVGDFDGRAADLLEFHEESLLVCFCVFNLTWFSAAEQKQSAPLPQQKCCGRMGDGGDQMNQKQLFYFLEVYRCRNIQAAADKLYLSH
jgi:hypothetical protein